MTKRYVKVAINLAAHIIGTIAMSIAAVFAVIVVAFISDGSRLEILEALIMAASILLVLANIIATIAIHVVKRTFYKLVDKSDKLVDLD